MNKTCTKCGETKTLDLFPKQATAPLGRNAKCKACAVRDTQQRQKTLTGLVKKIYHNQRMTSRRAGRALPDYTEAELLEWMLSQGYEAMWERWVASGYDKWLSPSIDRKDNTQSYTLDNIRFINWRTNLENQKQDNISGHYLHTGSKAVDQLTLEGEYIKTYPSIAIAMRDLTGKRGSVSNITAICEGKWKSAYGFKWRWAQPLS